MKWLISLLGFTSLAFASGTWDLENGLKGIYLEYSNYSGEDRYVLQCYDYFAYFALERPDEFETFRNNSVSEWGTDAVLFCRATYEAGDPYFWVSDFQYVSDGYTYNVEYGEYLEVTGQFGRMRPGTMVDVVLILSNANRPSTIQLYLEDDGTDFTFQELF